MFKKEKPSGTSESSRGFTRDLYLTRWNHNTRLQSCQEANIISAWQSYI